MRAVVLDVLRAKTAEIAEGGRFQDRGYADEAGRHHPRGGFWNAAPDAAALGYGKTDVADVVRSLRRRGLQVDPADVDAFLAQLVMTGRLDDAALVVAVGGRPITVRLDVDDTVPPPEPPAEIRTGGLLLLERAAGLWVVRGAATRDFTTTHVVLRRGDAWLCTCLVPDCGHAAAVAQRAADDDRLDHLRCLRLSDSEHAAAVRTLLPLLAARGLYEPRSRRTRGGQPRNTAQRVLQLLLRALLGPTFREHPDAAALVRLRIIDEPAGETTLARYRGDADVVAMLHELRVLATRGVRNTVPIATDDARAHGGRLAADIIHALRLEQRVTALHDDLSEDKVLDW